MKASGLQREVLRPFACLAGRDEDELGGDLFKGDIVRCFDELQATEMPLVEEHGSEKVTK